MPTYKKISANISVLIFLKLFKIHSPTLESLLNPVTSSPSVFFYIVLSFAPL